MSRPVWHRCRLGRLPRNPAKGGSSNSIGRDSFQPQHVFAKPVPGGGDGRRAVTDAGVVHASGRAQPAGVPPHPRRRLDPRGHQATRAGGRDHVAARAPLRRRRGRAVQRHRRARPRRRVRHRRRPRHRAGGRLAAAIRSRPGAPATAHTRRHRLRRRSGRDRRRRTAAWRARAGVRGRPVHGRQLPDRGPPQPRLPPHQGADAHRRSGCGTA